MRGTTAKAIRRLNRRGCAAGIEQARYRRDKRSGVVRLIPSARYFEKSLKRLHASFDLVRARVSDEIWLRRITRGV